MKHKKLKIIISGGGTGGHIYPAIAIADALKKYDNTIDILFVGAEDRVEMEKIPAAGYPIIGLPVQGLQRRLTYKNFLFIWKLLKSLKKSKKIVKNFKPHVAIGVGGYASGPLLFVAAKRSIPTIIQEQNSFPGITNKLLAKKVCKICVAYKGMERFFPKEKILLTGNPVRQNLIDIRKKKITALKYFNLNRHRKTLLVLGGSLGALTINQSLLQNLDKIEKTDIQIIWQTGKFYIEQVRETAKKYWLPHVRIIDFIDQMDYAYAAADLVVSRAGAITISELSIVAAPCILVPSPNVSEDHQTKNAIALVNSDAAYMVEDNKAFSQLIPFAFDLIKDDKKLKKLQQNIQQFALSDATKRIVDEIIKLTV